MSLCQIPISSVAHARDPAGHERDVAVVTTLRSPAAAAPASPTVVDACDDDDDAQPPSYPRVPLPQQQPPSPVVERIHPAESREAEGGVFYCHGMADASFLKQLDDLMDVAVSDGGSYNMAADRRWFNSEDIARQLQSMMPAALGVSRVLPDLRFIIYNGGGYIRPHVDGKRWDEATGRLSNTSFLFYLTSCQDSGSTRFLSSVASPSRVLADVFPRCNSLLLFPHDCPHEGDCVSGAAPKVGCCTQRVARDSTRQHASGDMYVTAPQVLLRGDCIVDIGIQQRLNQQPRCAGDPD
jgi:hypothetical protein